MKFLPDHLEFPVYPSKERFLSVPARTNSPLVSFSNEWRSLQSTVWHELALVKNTNELYLRDVHPGRLAVIAIFDDVSQALLALNGWEDVYLKPDSIGWLMELPCIGRGIMKSEVFGKGGPASQHPKLQRPELLTPEQILYG